MSTNSDKERLQTEIATVERILALAEDPLTIDTASTLASAFLRQGQSASFSILDVNEYVGYRQDMLHATGNATYYKTEAQLFLEDIQKDLRQAKLQLENM
jgi:hypothetical protein